MEYNYSKYWEGEYEKRKDYYKNIYSNVKSFYKFNPKDEIIDVGGGNGQFAHFIGAKNVTVLDISDTGLKFARKKFNFKIIKRDLRKPWNLNKKKCDVTFCNEILEHVPDPSFIISELSFILKKGGLLYIAQPNMKPDGEHHIKRIYFKYLKEILEKEGFKIEEYIAVPRFVNNFSYIKTKGSFLKKLTLFVINIPFFFIPKKLKYKLAHHFPSIIGCFYHVKARKV